MTAQTPESTEKGNGGLQLFFNLLQSGSLCKVPEISQEKVQMQLLGNTLVNLSCRKQISEPIMTTGEKN